MHPEFYYIVRGNDTGCQFPIFDLSLSLSFSYFLSLSLYVYHRCSIHLFFTRTYMESDEIRLIQFITLSPRHLCFVRSRNLVELSYRAVCSPVTLTLTCSSPEAPLNTYTLASALHLHPYTLVAGCTFVSQWKSSI